MTRFGRLVRRLARDETGVGAVEFALVIPLFLLVYMMGSQIALALSIDRKVEHASDLIGDLLTQVDDDLTLAEVDGILRLGPPLIEPYPSAPLSIVVAAVWVDDKGKAVVDCVRSNTPSTPTSIKKGAVFSLPSALSRVRQRTVLVTQTVYPHEPLGGYGLKTAFDLGDTSYLNPRSGGRLKWSGC